MPVITAIMNEFHAAMFRDPEEEDQWQADTFANAIIAGQSAGIFFAGDVLEVAAATATDQRIFTNSDNTLADATIKSFRSMNKILDGEFGEEDLMKDVNALSRSIGLLLGGPIGQAIGVIGRTGRDLTGSFEQLQEVGDNPSTLESELDRIAEVDQILREARSERRESDPDQEEPELPPNLAAIKKLQVGTGARA